MIVLVDHSYLFGCSSVVVQSRAPDTTYDIWCITRRCVKRRRERRVSREVKGGRPVLLVRGLCAVMWLAYLNGLLLQYTELRLLAAPRG
jgi:hypothetical protein